MQSKSRPLDDLTNLFTNAAGALKGVGDEVKAIGRSQGERLISELDLVGRDEFEVLKDMLLASRADVAALSKRVEMLETQLKASSKIKSGSR